ncbi:hypothetical protein [Methylobacterium sp. SyP6R]|uniref:hypothetical protein n=1 Tax=Methylobacterium sp. SyP6R TaxID=2718876 RepID=UPI001F4532FD|nr:hypothetical protein [Methylobacterium sp. SyP6R]MCF4127889.1 hypothetical protein [Methylobacterium sp. SyP6R]
MKGGALSSIDADVYEAPAAALVAGIVDSHGLEAACERWFWVGERTLCSLAQKGRAQKGDVAPRRTGGRGLSCSELDAAVAVEAGYVLGSAQRGIRAAGVSVGAQGLYSRRGLTPPTISSEERGIATSLGARARRGDAEAAAAWQARLDFEAAVGSVIRAALALVAEQPATGRHVLPPVDAALAEALRDQDPAAVAFAFPGLAALEPEPAEPEPEPPVTVIEPPPIPETVPMRRMSRMPTDNVLIAERAQGRSVAQMASDWEVKPSAIRAALRRIDEAAQVDAPAPEPLPTPRPEPARPPAPVPPPGRLSVDNLAIAVALARREGITPDEAVRFVRADVEQARARVLVAPFVPDRPPAGFPAPRMSPQYERWFQALTDGEDLPDLEIEDCLHV